MEREDVIMARKKQRSEAPKKGRHSSMKVDLSLLGIIIIILALIVYDMFVDRQLFANLMCTVVSLFVVVVTYFLGIIPGLTLNLIFIFVIVLGTIYQYVKTGNFVSGAIFWTIIPPLMSISLYFFTENVKKLQEENFELKREVGSETVDEETNLWSMDTYLEHFVVFSTLANDFHVPLSLYVVRVRYWNAVSGMMPARDQHELFIGLSDMLRDMKTGHEFVYLADSNPPTWAILSANEPTEGTQEFKEAFYNEFDQFLNTHPEIAKIDIQFAISHIHYDPAEHPTAESFFEDGVHELQYDV